MTANACNFNQETSVCFVILWMLNDGAMIAIEMHVCKLSVGLEKLKCENIHTTPAKGIGFGGRGVS